MRRNVLSGGQPDPIYVCYYGDIVFAWNFGYSQQIHYNEEFQKINFEEEQMQIEDEINLLLPIFNNERLILLHLIKLNILRQL